MKGNILIVDDQPANLALLEHLLEAEDYEVGAATSGARALQVIAFRAPELILLDINMPEMDGFEVCRRLKADTTTATIPVVFLSAQAETYDKLRAFAAGGQDYITKPFAVEEVLARVHTHLRLSRMERDLQAEVRQALAEREEAYTQMAAQNILLRRQQQALLAAETELRQWNAVLEQRVADRTTELQQANAALQRAMCAKDEFLSTMSHELRSPLNTILVSAEALAEGVYGVPGSQQRFPLHAITESAQHLLVLINDLLDLAKFEAGKVRLTLAPVEVEAVCQAALRLVQEPALKKRLSLTLQFDPQVGAIQADERCLKQILVNLLTNAVKFTPEGGKIGLKVCGQADARSVSFTVWDSGTGIAANELERLFKPFVQLDNQLTREHLGTGLGLALVRNMVELHGGSVSVESAVGRGSRFTISLPWLQPVAVDLAVPQPGAPLGKPGQGQLILLADDSELVIPSLVAYLQACQYQVMVARDGQEVIDLALTDSPALILMDIQMPKVDGLEATRRLRAQPETALIPIIALTALAMPGDRERCLAAGVSEYITKPVSLAKLADRVSALIAGSGEAQQRIASQLAHEV